MLDGAVDDFECLFFPDDWLPHGGGGPPNVTFLADLHAIDITNVPNKEDEEKAGESPEVGGGSDTLPEDATATAAAAAAAAAKEEGEEKRE